MSKNINTLSPGNLVYVYEDGVTVPYIFLQYNHYSQSEVTLLRKYTYPTAVMFRGGDTSTNAYNCYNNSNVDTMCTTHKSKLSSYLQGKLKAVNIPVAQGRTTTGGSVSSTIITLSRSCFLLSMTEYGLSGWKTEGTQFTAANTNRIAQAENNTSTAVNHWSRSPDSGGCNAYYVSTNGNANRLSVYSTYYFRPALTLQSGILVSSSPNESGVYLMHDEGATAAALWVKENGSWKKVLA